DLFSFGAVLYEMATGVLAFRGETTGVMFEAILNRVPPLAARLNPEIPPKLEEILQKALEKDREMRYQVAAEIRADLKRLRRETDSSGRSASSGISQASGIAAAAAPQPVSAPVPASQASSPSNSGSSSSVVLQAAGRHKLGVALTTLLILGIIAAAAFGVYSLFSHKKQEAFGQFTVTPVTETGKTALAAISPDGNYILNSQRQNGQQSLWLRNVPTNSNTQIIAPSDDLYHALHFSPDGNFIYFVRSEPNEKNVDSLFRAPVLGGTPERVVHNLRSNIGFSPDRSRLAFIRAKLNEGKFDLVIAASDGSNEKLLTEAGARLTSPAWSPDGKMLAVNELFAGDSAVASLDLFDVATGQKQALLKSDMFLDDATWLP
ncbi:MAG: hypothetical protein ACRD4Y_09770, partial [Candidatus Acidiferrales bacterium]